MRVYVCVSCDEDYNSVLVAATSMTEATEKVIEFLVWDWQVERYGHDRAILEAGERFYSFFTAPRIVPGLEYTLGAEVITLD